MANRFHLTATVSTDDPAAVGPVLREHLSGRGSVEETGVTGEFRVQADLEGASAKELNRSLLSALRRVEKKTRLRAAWESGGTVEQFFDYVLKKTTAKDS